MAKTKKYAPKKPTSSVKEVLETPTITPYNKTVRLINQISARVRLQGFVTRDWYEWSKAGAIISVDKRDAPALLEKRLGEKHCCGGTPNIIFTLVE